MIFTARNLSSAIIDEDMSSRLRCKFRSGSLYDLHDVFRFCRGNRGPMPQDVSDLRTIGRESDRQSSQPIIRRDIARLVRV